MHHPEDDLEDRARPHLFHWPESFRSARWAPLPAAVIGALLLALVVLAVVGFRVWQAAAGESAEQVPIAAAPATASPEAPGDPAEDRSGGSPAETAEGPSALDAAESATVVVHVTGAVQTPGVVEVLTGARVHDAVNAAGGLQSGADTTRINLARVVGDGELIWVPMPGEDPPEQAVISDPPVTGSADSAASQGDTQDQGTLTVNLNTADQSELERLPGVGPVTAAAILTWREERGAFTSAEELLEVSGIGPRTLEKLRPHLTW